MPALNQIAGIGHFMRLVNVSPQQMPARGPKLPAHQGLMLARITIGHGNSISPMYERSRSMACREPRANLGRDGR